MKQFMQPVPYWVTPDGKPPVANTASAQRTRVENVRDRLSRCRVFYESKAKPGEVPHICIASNGTSALLLGCTLADLERGRVVGVVE